jgi:hypothetical protein
MKSILSAALVVATSLTIAQPYGQNVYQNNSRLDWGNHTSIHSNGFLMSGIWNPGSTEEIQIIKTDVGGSFNATPSEFKRRYKVYNVSTSCAVTPIQVTALSGVTSIETTAGSGGGTGGERYAFVTSHDKGIIFATLDIFGDIVNSYFFPFPTTAFAFNKPVIVESSTPGDFFITGSFDTQMYAMCVDWNGTVKWSKYYDANGPAFEPRDIIISAHNGDVIIVGHLSPDIIYMRGSDGFFLSLDPTNGNVNSFVDYSSTPCNWFNTVKTAFCPTGGIGYVVGGYTDPLYNTGSSLMMKLDLNGNIIWNTLITGGTPGHNSNEIVDVVERQNSMNVWEYYGLSVVYDVSTSWPTVFKETTVFKLDPFGNPVMGAFNEFHYNGSSTSELIPKRMSFQNMPSANDVGLHMYIDNSTNFYLQESYFNGVVGCNNETFNYILATEPGPTDINPNITTSAGPSLCGQLMVPEFLSNFTTVQCSNMAVFGGNNLRTVTIVTEIDSPEFNLFPNPFLNDFTIECSSESKLEIFSSLGELVYETTCHAGPNRISVEWLTCGVYETIVRNSEGSRRCKILKE